MNHLLLLFPLLLSLFCSVQAQPSTDQNGVFVPSIAALIVFFILVIFISVLLALWTRRWYRARAQLTPDGLVRPNQRSSGIDRTVIESLPVFKFSALRGLRGGLECAVCLSKFEDIEILRLLPKCKHAFHINCVDRWLENHSTCPLCRQRISVDEDLTYSNSLRFLSSQSEVREDSNLELFVEREDSRRQASSIFSIESSFRLLEKGVEIEKEDEIAIREDSDCVDENDKFLHKFNHKIIMSDAVLKSRWSNLSSSDHLFLNSEMLGDVSSNRFTREIEGGGILKIKDTMERQRDAENKFGKLTQKHPYLLSSGANTSDPTRDLRPNEKRSMSEIVVHSRFRDFNTSGNQGRNQNFLP